MTLKRPLIVASLAALAAGATIAFAADAPASAPASQPAAPKAAPAAPDHLQVQHVLIGFKGSVPGKNITRTQEEAKALADDILARAWKGVDFAALVEKYTDDAAPGIYGMSNNSVDPAQGETPRGRMVKGFGDVAFSLKVGEIGMASHDPATSPFGWHIIKRIK